MLTPQWPSLEARLQTVANHTVSVVLHARSIHAERYYLDLIWNVELQFKMVSIMLLINTENVNFWLHNLPRKDLRAKSDK